MLHDYDVENQFELGDLADESGDEAELGVSHKSMDARVAASNKKSWDDGERDALAGSGSVRVKREKEEREGRKSGAGAGR